MPLSALFNLANNGKKLIVITALAALILMATPISNPAQASAAASATPQQQPPLSGQSMSYSELIDAVDKDLVVGATIANSRGVAQVRLKNQKEPLLVGIPNDSSLLVNKLDRAGAKVTIQRNLDEGSNLFFLIPLLILIGGAILVFIIIMVQGRKQRKALNKGEKKNSKEVSDSKRPKATFADVAGCDEAIAEVSEFLAFLQDPTPFQAVGAKMPRGIILHGPPGTGKTLLAKALAGESGCSFFSVSGSEFVERYVGVGASRVRELFADARKNEDGAVIFIDEIDAIGKSRASGAMANVNDEREQTLNQLLVEMDGFKSEDKVVVVAATNRIDTLDKALLRPGRLSRQVHVGLPALQGRKEILEVHSKDKPLADDVSLDELADYTAGSSGADLANMLNEAAIMAARDRRDLITQADLKEGHLRALAGPEKQDSMMADEEREVVAYHEAGHVLTAELCPEHDKAQRATIKPRGQAGGMAVYGQKDRALQSAELIHQKLVVALGGRAAEAVVFGRVTSGAANDLQMANHIARQAVEELGFSPDAGQLVRVREEGFSDTTRAVLDSEVERLVAEAYNEALDLLAAERDALDRLADKLLEAEDVDRLEIKAAISGSIIARPRGPQKMQPQRRPVEIELEVEQEEQASRGEQLVSAVRAYLPEIKIPRRQKEEKGGLADAE